MKNTEVLVWLWTAIGAIAGFPALESTAQDAAERPNFIFILTDDQGYGDLSRHGHPLLKTPVLDKLAEESVRFDNFYVSPSCSPTRAALLTGMHEFRSGVTHTLRPRQRLHPSAVTLPQLLQKAGYRTGHVGKWHLGAAKEYAPKSRGFDWSSTNRRGPLNHFDPVMVRNGEKKKCAGYREDVYFDEAMAFIDESRDQPFFCFLATYSPHTPLAAPDEFIDPFRDQVTSDQATYLGMVANIDFNVGRLLEFLKDRELEENTIVIFMNDNGQTVGLDVYNANMRGCKCTVWEGGSRAMSFWRWPDRWKPKTVNNLTAHLDLLPTLCELAGAEIPDDLQAKLDGFSLRPLLEADGSISWHDDRILFHHVARWPGGLAASHKYAQCAVRQGKFLLLRSAPCDDPDCTANEAVCTSLRLVQNGLTSMTYTENDAPFHWGVSPPGKWVLFDIKRDPACETDLATQRPDLVVLLSRAYEDWWYEIYPQMIEMGGDVISPEPTPPVSEPLPPALMAIEEPEETKEPEDGMAIQRTSKLESRRSEVAQYRLISLLLGLTGLGLGLLAVVSPRWRWFFAGQGVCGATTLLIWLVLSVLLSAHSADPKALLRIGLSIGVLSGFIAGLYPLGGLALQQAGKLRQKPRLEQLSWALWTQAPFHIANLIVFFVRFATIN